MSKVRGRTDDTLIIGIRGVDVFRTSVEAAPLGGEGLEPPYVIFDGRRKDRMEELKVWVEASPHPWDKGDCFQGNESPNCPIIATVTRFSKEKTNGWNAIGSRSLNPPNKTQIARAQPARAMVRSTASPWLYASPEDLLSLLQLFPHRARARSSDRFSRLN
jgi:hypothetical protein